MKIEDALEEMAFVEVSKHRKGGGYVGDFGDVLDILEAWLERDVPAGTRPDDVIGQARSLANRMCNWGWLVPTFDAPLMIPDEPES